MSQLPRQLPRLQSHSGVGSLLRAERMLQLRAPQDRDQPSELPLPLRLENGNALALAIECRGIFHGAHLMHRSSLVLRQGVESPQLLAHRAPPRAFEPCRARPQRQRVAPGARSHRQLRHRASLSMRCSHQLRDVDERRVHQLEWSPPSLRPQPAYPEDAIGDEAQR